jgi:hypothetical protein
MGRVGEGTGARDGGRSCGSDGDSWVVGKVTGAMYGVRWVRVLKSRTACLREQSRGRWAVRV